MTIWRSRRRKSDRLQTKLFTSHGYKSHQTVQGTAANELLAAVSNEPLSLCYPCPVCKNGERVDADALCALAACPSGGQNCPRVPPAIPHLNCPVTSLKVHLRAGSRGSRANAKLTRYCMSYPKDSPIALAKRKSPQLTEPPRPYLKSPKDE